jgi:Transposase DDE domain
VTNDIDTLATALYVRTDDLLKQYPDLAPWRPAIGLQPRLTDAELVTLAVMQALLGYTSGARWIRQARGPPGAPVSLPGWPARLQQAAARCRRLDHHVDPVAGSGHQPVDRRCVGGRFHPVECGRSRDTAKRSDLAGWAEYGYCASHSRYFGGLRLRLIATLGGLPVAFALTGAERQTLLGILAADPALAATRPGQTLIADRQYYGTSFEATLAAQHLHLLRLARKGERDRPGAPLFKPLRQTIESINQTFKGQLDLERHGGHTPAGVMVRVLQRILALTAAIWHNDRTSAPVHRSLTAYDH